MKRLIVLRADTRRRRGGESERIKSNLRGGRDDGGAERRRGEERDCVRLRTDENCY